MSRLSYQTKQKKAILDFLKLNCDEHITISQISEYLRKVGVQVGTTTIYRNMDALVEQGIVKKYAMEGNAGAYFEYIGDIDEPQRQFHFRCKDCGKLLHFQSEKLQMLDAYFKEEVPIKIDLGQTVFYGICDICFKNEIKEVSANKDKA